MKTTKITMSKVQVDPELMEVFKETFGDDYAGMQEALAEAERALSYVREDSEWYGMFQNGEYELF